MTKVEEKTYLLTQKIYRMTKSQITHTFHGNSFMMSLKFLNILDSLKVNNSKEVKRRIFLVAVKLVDTLFNEIHVSVHSIGECLSVDHTIFKLHVLFIHIINVVVVQTADLIFAVDVVFLFAGSEENGK